MYLSNILGKGWKGEEAPALLPRVSQLLESVFPKPSDCCEGVGLLSLPTFAFFGAFSLMNSCSAYSVAVPSSSRVSFFRVWSGLQLLFRAQLRSDPAQSSVALSCSSRNMQSNKRANRVACWQTQKDSTALVHVQKCVFATLWVRKLHFVFKSNLILQKWKAYAHNSSEKVSSWLLVSGFVESPGQRNWVDSLGNDTAAPFPNRFQNCTFKYYNFFSSRNQLSHTGSSALEVWTGHLEWGKLNDHSNEDLKTVKNFHQLSCDAV